MNVRLIMAAVTPMLTVLTLMAASHVCAGLGSMEMGSRAQCLDELHHTNLHACY